MLVVSKAPSHNQVSLEAELTIGFCTYVEIGTVCDSGTVVDKVD